MATIGVIARTDMYSEIRSERHINLIIEKQHTTVIIHHHCAAVVFRFQYVGSTLASIT